MPVDPRRLTGAVELVGAAVVLVEPELVELLHAARKMTVTASSRGIQTPGRTVDDGCISRAPPSPFPPSSWAARWDSRPRSHPASSRDYIARSPGRLPPAHRW